MVVPYPFRQVNRKNPISFYLEIYNLGQRPDGTSLFDITYTATPLAAAVELWILAAVVNSAGITYVRNLLRFIGVSAAAQASPLDIQTLVEDKFGTLIVGQTLHVRVSTYDTATGLLSVGLEDSVVITTS